MSDPISGIAGNAISQYTNSAAKQSQHQAGTTSFENVLQSGGGNSGDNARAHGVQSRGTTEVELAPVPEQARLDLLRRVGSLPPGSPNITALLPELFDARTRTNWLKQAVSGLGDTPKATDLRGSLGHVENEWNQFDAIMKSGKEMSQGDLLTMQARLYQLTQHVEVLSKVVDQVTGGVKTIINTNV